ncbi:beta-lactamase [Flammeovirgaceae bacterium 311]|nr:beta-lactamase [Flammeovirgaceae bacterium 311]
MKKARVVIIPVVAILVMYLLAPTYLRKAFTYFTPDIDDYTVFENREVRAGFEEEPWPTQANFNKIGLPDTLLEKIDALDPVALLMVKDGSLVFEQYWDGYGPTSYSNSFSMAKSIVSLLIGIAVQEGQISSLDDPIGRYLPAYQGQPATVRHLLMMSSGLDWDESYSSPLSVTTKAYYGDNLRELLNGLSITDSPSEVWNYQSGNTQLLAMILENASGLSLSEYASQMLWKPLGASRNALWSLDERDGIEKAYCCFNSNARDFARIGQLVLDSGQWQGRQLVPKPYLRKALAPQTQLIDEEGRRVDYYGYHWWLIPFNGELIPYARGILGQYIFVFPRERAILVRLGHERDDEYINAHPADVYLYLETARYLMKRYSY